MEKIDKLHCLRIAIAVFFGCMAFFFIPPSIAYGEEDGIGSYAEDYAVAARNVLVPDIAGAYGKRKGFNEDSGGNG